MKGTLRNSGELLVVLLALMALPAYAQLMIGHMFHGHGSCTIETGTFPVEFAAYQVPGPGEDQNLAIHPHCDHIPTAGAVRLSVDLMEPPEREMPLALRLVKVDGNQEKELVSVPAKTYASGIVALETQLDQDGQYALLLDFDKSEKYAGGKIRIPLHVGEGGGHGFPWLGAGVGLILLLAAGGGTYYYWLNRRPGSEA